MFVKGSDILFSYTHTSKVKKTLQKKNTRSLTLTLPEGGELGGMENKGKTKITLFWRANNPKREEGKSHTFPYT